MPVNNSLQINEKTFSKVVKWVSATNELAFFEPLIMSTRVNFKELDYMLGRFGADGAVITTASELFLGNEFLLNITPKQTIYLILHLLLQIAHLTPHRLMPYVDDRTPFPNIDPSTREACASIAASLCVNEELASTTIMDKYYEVMAGANHVTATVSKENYWAMLGWDRIEDIPDPIKDIDSLLNTTVEKLAALFIQFHNPDNPPKMPSPLWAQATDSEKGGRSDEALKSHAKMLAKRAASNAIAKKQAGQGGVFCPFEVDDLALLNASRVNYKSMLDLMIVDSQSNWEGYDRRDLNNVDYNYAMVNTELSCVVYCDTSGSLAANVKDILAEVWGITKVNNARILIKYFSSGVEKQDEEVWIDSGTDITSFNLPTSSGGTEWAPVAEDIVENHRADNIVIITDGYFFDEITPIDTNGKVLIVLTQNYNDKIDWAGEYNFLVGYSDIPD